jgi:hypothetical protein
MRKRFELVLLLRNRSARRALTSLRGDYRKIYDTRGPVHASAEGARSARRPPGCAPVPTRRGRACRALESQVCASERRAKRSHEETVRLRA